MGFWDQVSSVDLGDQAVLAVQVLAAVIAGGIVGFERELAGKRAGLRTHMIVAAGSALAVGLGEIVLDGGGGDATRVFHGLLTGIGFIGAGAILTGKRAAGGLTTAATVFLVAILGAACAFGAPLLALAGAVLTVMLLRGIYRVDMQMRALVAKMRGTSPTDEDDDLG